MGNEPWGEGGQISEHQPHEPKGSTAKLELMRAALRCSARAKRTAMPCQAPGAAVAGALIALRFTALIIIPVVMLGMALVITVGVTTGTNFWMVCLQTISVVVSVQVGYLAGVCISLGYRPGRASPVPGAGT